MTRESDITFSVSNIEVLYHDVTQMPWEKLEEVARITFDKAAREELLWCTDEYASGLGWWNGSPTTNELTAVRDDILEHAKALVAIASKLDWKPPADEACRYSHSDEISKQPERLHTRNLIDALSLRFGNQTSSGPGNLTFEEALGTTFHAAQGLIKCLESGDELPRGQQGAEKNQFPDSTGKVPESFALSRFLVALLSGAQARAARGSTKNSINSRTGNEYERWGLRIGPRCRGFPEFVSILLQRPVTIDQLRTAWPD